MANELGKQATSRSATTAPCTSDLEEQVFQAKKEGLSDRDIGKKFNVNLRFIEKVMTKRLGVNVSSPIVRKSVRRLQPADFSLETTTVWSFKSRGNWATHNGNYRGNWSPYIPRNVILRYSRPGDLVLDCFCGAGTTGVECKLTGRNFTGIDINPMAIELARKNVDFSLCGEDCEHSTQTSVEFKVGDARDLSCISDESIDLICTHPPYADIIHYTDNQKEDLSFYPNGAFIQEMGKVAKENYRVLKPDGYCAVLIGDMRKRKSVVPLGFSVINQYLGAGFSLKELVIKRQHNCKTTGFWYNNSVKYNFLLLAHEYLAVFQKASADVSPQAMLGEDSVEEITFEPARLERLESTTVWTFEHGDFWKNVVQNLVQRYDGAGYSIISRPRDIDVSENILCSRSLVIVSCAGQGQFTKLRERLEKLLSLIPEKGYLAVVCRDVRLRDGTIYPTAVEVESCLRNRSEFKIKEIVIVPTGSETHLVCADENLAVSHIYLLIYSVRRDGKI